MCVRILLTLLFVSCWYASVSAIAAEKPAAGAAARGAPLGADETAPDFTLQDQEGRTHSLSAQRGKNIVILVFYRGHW